MEKHLLTIEFRYADVPKNDNDSGHRSKTITIGIYDSFDEACVYGNLALENLESKFPLHVFPDGRKAPSERFSKNGGPFGCKRDLVTDMAYLKTPFAFFAKIKTLDLSNLDETINEVTYSNESYRSKRNN